MVPNAFSYLAVKAKLVLLFLLASSEKLIILPEPYKGFWIRPWWPSGLIRTLRSLLLNHETPSTEPGSNLALFEGYIFTVNFDYS